MGAVTSPPSAARVHFDPAEMEARAFYRVLNSVVVPRPIAWVCSRSAEGVVNLAPHSFYTVACVDPPVVQFTSVGRKDSLRNVEATGEFTVSLTPGGAVRAGQRHRHRLPARPQRGRARRRPPRAQRARVRAAGGRVAGGDRVRAALDAAARRQHRRLRAGAAHQRLGERGARRAAADRAPASRWPASAATSGRRSARSRRSRGSPTAPGPTTRRSASASAAD